MIGFSEVLRTRLKQIWLVLGRACDRFRYLVMAFRSYLLAWIKRRLAIRTTFIGITGSVGKTTTKDICANMLSEFSSCGYTQKSYNRHLSIAKELAEMRWSQRYFIVEISASKPGFLDRSLWLSKPSIGVLTTIGRDHYKAFKSIENIAQEKAKIVRKLPRNGIAVLNMDNPLVKAIGEEAPNRKIWVGRSEGATIRLVEVSSKWPEPLTLTVEHDKIQYRVKTRLYGEHMALAVLCSLGVAVALGLPLDKAIAGVSKAEPAEGRMQIVEGEDGVVFIRDDWKAPEWTLHAPIEFLGEADAKRKVAIIGSISDFSGDSSRKYKQVAKRVMTVADLTIFIGPNAHRAVRARSHPDDQSLMGFERIIDAARFLKRELRAGDLVLLKGSAKTDHLVRLLYDRYEPVQCWIDQCGIDQFCGVCPKLYKSPNQDGQAAAIKTSEGADSVWGERRGKSTIIIGLGNPGAEYEDTPHNIGYKVVDTLACRMGASWRECQDGLVTQGMISPDNSVLLFKPSAKMNVSGALVRRFLLEQNGHPENCIVVHDEMDLKLGDVRFKFEGSSAGHNGIKSVLSELGSHSFTRLRVGVRASGTTARARQSVLAAFRVEDKPHVEEGVTKALELIAQAVKDSGRTSDKATHSS